MLAVSPGQAVVTSSQRRPARATAHQTISVVPMPASPAHQSAVTCTSPFSLQHSSRLGAHAGPPGTLPTHNEDLSREIEQGAFE